MKPRFKFHGRSIRRRPTPQTTAPGKSEVGRGSAQAWPRPSDVHSRRMSITNYLLQWLGCGATARTRPAPPLGGCVHWRKKTWSASSTSEHRPYPAEPTMLPPEAETPQTLAHLAR